MAKVDSTVRKETLYVFAWILIFSAVLESVFLIIGKWDLNVLFGNLLGMVAAVANFFLMGISFQKALSNSDEKQIKSIIKASQSMRLFFMFVALAVGVYFFNPIAVILPIFIPSLSMRFRPLFDKKLNTPSNTEIEQ